jgi:hypothetical protein
VSTCLAGVALVERAAPVSSGRGFCRSGRSASLAAPDPASPRAHPRIATREGEPDRATLDGVGPRAEYVRLLFLSAILPIDVDWKQQAAFQAGPSDFIRAYAARTAAQREAIAAYG